MIRILLHELPTSVKELKRRDFLFRQFVVRGLRISNKFVLFIIIFKFLFDYISVTLS
jgi:hypothetical protein